MAKRISNFFYSISGGWVALAGLLVFLLFTATVLPAQAARAEEVSGDAGSPDSSFFYSTDDLYQYAEAYGESGRSAYIRARFTFDIIWPLVYLFFLGTSLSWALHRALPAESKWRLLNLFPVLGWLFDWLENISASIVMANYPDQTPIVDVLTTVFTPIKWIFVNGSFVILLGALLYALWGWINSKRSSHP